MRAFTPSIATTRASSRSARNAAVSAAHSTIDIDEGPDRVREAYPGPTWDRLVEVKRRWDPGNLFRRNQNIPPG